MRRYNTEDTDRIVARNSGGGIGFCGLLTIVFIVLKLCGVITWNWFWVLSPLVFSAGLAILIIIISLIIIAISQKN